MHKHFCRSVWSREGNSDLVELTFIAWIEATAETPHFWGVQFGVETFVMKWNIACVHK